jgi:hypothetical protein
MLRIESLEIDDHILEKIERKHDVKFEEVEEACLSEQRHVCRGREGLYKVFGQTVAGRYVLAVLVDKGGGDWKVASVVSQVKLPPFIKLMFHPVSQVN